MIAFDWSNEMGHRSRAAWLLFVKGDGVIPFAGQSVPGVVAVRATDYTKNGKWSHTIYHLALGDGVVPIAGKDGWETGTFAEGLVNALLSYDNPAKDELNAQYYAIPSRTSTNNAIISVWDDLAAALGVSRESAEKFLRSWRPKVAEKIDETERDLALL